MRRENSRPRLFIKIFHTDEDARSSKENDVMQEKSIWLVKDQSKSMEWKRFPRASTAYDAKQERLSRSKGSAFSRRIHRFHGWKEGSGNDKKRRSSAWFRLDLGGEMKAFGSFIRKSVVSLAVIIRFMLRSWEFTPWCTGLIALTWNQQRHDLTSAVFL